MYGTILFADRFDPALLACFSGLGWPVVDGSNATRSGLMEQMAEAEILVVRSRTIVNPTLIKNAPLLKLVIRGGSGIEHIDSDALYERGISLITTPQANARAVGEQAAGMILALFNQFKKAERGLSQFQWLRNECQGTEIAGKTVGIIGCGHSGTAVAKVLLALGANVIAYDKYKAGFSDGSIREVTLAELKKRADVISFHVPLNSETRHYLDSNFIASVENPFWLLNLSRGEVVYTSALIRGLESGKILGAGIDVLENEQVDQLTETQAYELKTLLDRDNVIITPHTGGLTAQAERRINDAVSSAITRYISERHGLNSY